MDRNISVLESYNIIVKSLSARRAWIEIFSVREVFANFDVALRKESVDRNYRHIKEKCRARGSLSARRAWIEMSVSMVASSGTAVALRKESVDRNDSLLEEQARLVQSLSARRAWIEMSIT